MRTISPTRAAVRGRIKAKQREAVDGGLKAPLKAAFWNAEKGSLCSFDAIHVTQYRMRPDGRAGQRRPMQWPLTH
jgi:hypothetical protein